MDEFIDDEEREEYIGNIERLNDKLNDENNRLRRAIGELCDANVNVIDFCRSRGVVVGKDGIVADLLKATEPTP